MNAIRQTALLNKRELENATPPSASWHADYRDTAWIYVGGLPLDLTEGDVCIIFSQFGNPTHLNMIRDKETGKSKGFGFLKYEDQRSCDLAVDNLGGAEVLGRMLRVDHTRYKKREGEDEETYRIEAREREQLGDQDGPDTDVDGEDGGRRKKRRKLLKEEVELQEMLTIKADGEKEDPMRAYLIEEKKVEVGKAKAREKEKRRHKHHHRHRDQPEDNDNDNKRVKERKNGPDEHRMSKYKSHDIESDDRRHRREEKSDRRRSRDRDEPRLHRRSPSRSRSISS